MKQFSKLITESNKLAGLSRYNLAILFSDVKGSSDLWSTSEDGMFKAITKLEDLTTEVVNNNNGMIVKTIGDSFMCSYESKNSLFDSIKSAYDMQKSLIEDPIKVGNKDVKLRIGICFGEVYVREVEIQGNLMKDYFGNTVNTASRMESKVSEVDGFAFSFLDEVDNQKEILNYLESNSINVEVIKYDNNCSEDSIRKRSARLLTDLQISACKDIEELKGVQPVKAYKCKLDL